MAIDFKRLLENGYDGIYVTEKALSLKGIFSLYGENENVQGLLTWDVESLCVFNPDVVVPLEENTEKLTESELKWIVTECAKRLIIKESDEDYNIKGVYHVSSDKFDEFELRHFNYYFFSSKPIDINGNKYIYKCNLSMHRPLIFDGCGMSWSYPLWLFLSNRDGSLISEEEFTPEKYDGYLGAPYEFWKKVYYDEDEYEIDQVAEVVMQLDGDYDGVIVKDVSEGNTSIDVDDYIVFNKSQIQIVSVLFLVVVILLIILLLLKLH